MTYDALKARFPTQPESFWRRNCDPGTAPDVSTVAPAPKRGRPTVRKNDGRPWQEEILRVARVYSDLGVLKLEKVDAPNRFVGKKIIAVANPFPDFVGCWHRSGRMLALEAKSTAEPRLGIDVKSGGLTVRQVKLLRAWNKSGAVAGVLWEHGGRAKWWPWPQIQAELDKGQRAIWFELGGYEVPAGLGFVTRDFARVFEDLRY